MCLLVRDRPMPPVMTVVRVVVHDVGVTDVFAKHRGRNLGSIRRILMGD